MHSQIHVVSKKEVGRHATLSVTLPQLPLADSSVRVRTKLISITANNLGYATLGALFGWWNTYPVPAMLPAPYSDSKQWGIVPAWGYAQVVESTKKDIRVGSLIWGFWPTCTHPVDLLLEPSEPRGWYREASPRRSNLMTLYNSYQLVAGLVSEDQMAWRSAVYPVWTCGYLLSRYTFAARAGAQLHPLGVGQWTAQDADLTEAVVVSLSATSKTGRSFAWNLARRAAGEGPLGLLQASASPGSVPELSDASFENRAAHYDNLASPGVISWMAGFKPKRVVVVDFGGASGTIQRIRENLRSALPPSTALKFIGVCTESFKSGHFKPNAESAEDSGLAVESADKIGVVQFNTSGVKDAAIAAQGAEAFLAELDAAFQIWLDDTTTGGLELLWGAGVGGENGVEGIWEAMCNGNSPGQKAPVFRL